MNIHEILQTLENMNPTTFCNGIGKSNSVKSNSQTRDKKNAIKAIKKAFDMLEGLGIKGTYCIDL